jgi:hypothetical protein
MDSPPKTLKATLEAIRDMAVNGLNQIAASQEEHSMRWKCKACRYVKHFTKPVPLETDVRDAKVPRSHLFCEQKHVSGKWRFSVDVL